jgi:hypothetical protein
MSTSHVDEKLVARLVAVIESGLTRRPEPESLDSKVVRMAGFQGRRNREPQLSDAELIAVRRMLADFEKIARSCPTARHILDR